MSRIRIRLDALALPGAIPFVTDRGNGVADYGYAAAEWVVETYHWLCHENENAVPEVFRHRILALLLGYGGDAVGELEQQERLQRFSTTALPVPAAR